MCCAGSCQCGWASQCSQAANRDAKSCCLRVGHSRPGALQDHHHSLLPRGHGLHPHVRHHQWGVLRRRAGLVSSVFVWPYPQITNRFLFRGFNAIIWYPALLTLHIFSSFWYKSPKLNGLLLTATVYSFRSDIWLSCYVACILVSLSGSQGKLVKVKALVHSWVMQASGGWTVARAQMSVIYDDAFFISKTGLGRGRSIGCRNQVSGLRFLLQKSDRVIISAKSQESLESQLRS